MAEKNPLKRKRFRRLVIVHLGASLCRPCSSDQVVLLSVVCRHHRVVVPSFPLSISYRRDSIERICGGCGGCGYHRLRSQKGERRATWPDKMEDVLVLI